MATATVCAVCLGLQQNCRGARNESFPSKDVLPSGTDRHTKRQQTPPAPSHLQKGDHKRPEGKVRRLLQLAVKFLDRHR